MANLIAVTVYGSNQNDWNAPLGVDMAFPPSQIVCKALPEDTYYSGVLCAASVSLLPTAPSTIQPVYYTDLTVAELITAADA